jgi:hypothetical protein
VDISPRRVYDRRREFSHPHRVVRLVEVAPGVYRLAGTGTAGEEAARKLEADLRAMPRWKVRALASRIPLGPRERAWVLRGHRWRFTAYQAVRRLAAPREARPRSRRVRTPRQSRAGPDSEPHLAFARFDAALRFLPPSARCRLFLRLPERLQEPFWADLGRRVEERP